MASGPRNRAEYISYLKAKLGGEAQRIELSKTNFDHIVNDAIEYFNEYCEDFSANSLYKLDTEEGVVEYVLPDAVSEVIEVLQTGTVSSILGIFPHNVANGAIFHPFGSFQGFHRVGGIGNFDIEINLQDTEMFTKRFLSRHLWDYNSFTNKIIFHNKIDKGEIGLIVSEMIDADGEGKSKLWNYKWFKDYGEALAWIQWGVNLGKFDGLNVLGGATLNWREFIERGTEMKRRLEDDIIPKLVDLTSFGGIHMG